MNEELSRVADTVSEASDTVWEIVTEPNLLAGVALMSIAVLTMFWIAPPICRLFVRPLVGRFSKRDADRRKALVRSISKPLGFLIGAAVFHVGVGYFARGWSDGGLGWTLGRVAVSFYIFGLFWLLITFMPPLVHRIDAASETVTELMADWIARIIGWILWVICIVTIVESWGVSIAPVVAGLGVAGAAIALSAQDFVKSLIAGLIVVGEGKLDVGQYVEIGSVNGTVERIGLRSTEIRGLDRSLQVLPNSNLITEVIRNHSLRNQRRIIWELGMEYGIPSENLVKIRDRIDAYLRNHESIAKEELISVTLKGFAASSIDIEILAYLTTNDFSVWRGVRDELVRAIRKIVDEEGGAFAFPSKTVYLRNES